MDSINATIVSDHLSGLSSIKKCPTSSKVLYVVGYFGSTLSRKYNGIRKGETASESPQYSRTGTLSFRNAANHLGSKRALKIVNKLKFVYQLRI